ncbi:flagellin N-terminal helical domain-containing protein, partial [Alteromonas sp. ASW11-130]|uniref:flagellin N-terminal helical domain-containing protein n=1 Tax=Alteromonas sp. ASW11-130 TaxID=3015775 RepID=UPI0022C5DD68|nr:flagellin FliC [Alteromonas sp. ASW11-130]
MSMFVNTNVSALNAQRQMFDTNNSLNTSFERLSSGFRINSAADDAAGLQISDRMTTQVQGLNMAVRNANDAISLSQTAEGALDETTNTLQRIRQLAIQSQNGINSDADRGALQKEVAALKTEMSRIASDTQFNGVNVLNGSYSADFQV